MQDMKKNLLMDTTSLIYVIDYYEYEEQKLFENNVNFIAESAFDAFYNQRNVFQFYSQHIRVKCWMSLIIKIRDTENKQMC